MKLKPMIGLAVHAQLLTGSKIFCGCSIKNGMPPNMNICPVCSSFPGVRLDLVHNILNQKLNE